MIHFASQPKPWNIPSIEYSSEWWRYAKQTPFYEEILYNLSTSVSQQTYTSMLSPKVRDFRRKSGRLIDTLFPKGSRIRKFVSQTFPINSSGRKFIDHFYLKKQFR